MLDELRAPVRSGLGDVRRIQPRATTAISLVGTDGGNNRVQFDPSLSQLVRVVDSSNNEHALEVVTPTTHIERLSRKHRPPGSAATSALRRGGAAFVESVRGSWPCADPRSGDNRARERPHRGRACGGTRAAASSSATWRARTSPRFGPAGRATSTRVVVVEGDWKAEIGRITALVPPHGMNIALIDPFGPTPLKWSTIATVGAVKRMDFADPFSDGRDQEELLPLRLSITRSTRCSARRHGARSLTAPSTCRS